MSHRRKICIDFLFKSLGDKPSALEAGLVLGGFLKDFFFEGFGQIPLKIDILLHKWAP